MTLIRYLALLLPVAALVAAAWADRTRAGRAGALLAFLGAFIGVGALHEAARVAGWWSFAPVQGSFRGMPEDLWLGWAILWGPIPVLLRRFVPVPWALLALAWLDILVMPHLEPLVLLTPPAAFANLADGAASPAVFTLPAVFTVPGGAALLGGGTALLGDASGGWLVGEALGILFVALPAQLAGRWSADRRHLTARVLLQMAIFGGLAVWLVPHVTFEIADGSWAAIAAHSPEVLFVAAQLGLLVATPTLIAVMEFARRGNGTPYPWDPPDRLITTGPYAYLANPMQTSVVLVLLLLAALAGSWGLVAAAINMVAFSAAIAAIHERDQLGARFGQQWRTYRTGVRDWLPRLRPYPRPSATLWLDTQCGQCEAVRGHLARRGPRGLRLAAAASHEKVLWRAQYEAADGHIERGVAAVARGLEHLHLGWAYAGWLLRLPGMHQLAQLISDALIVGPHPARAEEGTCRTPSSGSSMAPCARSGNTA